MNKNLYSRLARTNIKNNRNTYFPYIFSSIVAISMFNILLIITNRAKQADFYGDSSMIAILMFGVFVIGLFSLLFIFYTNSFLLKRRTKELGLYSVLGMEKKHIVKVLFYEILYSGLISIGTGIIVGLIFTRLMFAILLNLLYLDTAISLSISWFSIGVTILVFLLIYLVVLVYNIIKIYRLNPIDLITGGKKGKHGDKINFISTLKGKLNESIEGVNGVEDRYTTRQDFISLYGSLFFIGIFLGTLFMIATVLIIYYKQISEGYDDRERFIILQKVGMSKEEVKKTIKSQILLTFKRWGVVKTSSVGILAT